MVLFLHVFQINTSKRFCKKKVRGGNSTKLKPTLPMAAMFIVEIKIIRSFGRGLADHHICKVWFQLSQ